MVFLHECTHAKKRDLWYKPKNNTGLILNAVHSRDNCFLYLKEIVKGESYVVLSQEEVEALRKAVNFGLGEIEKEQK